MDQENVDELCDQGVFAFGTQVQAGLDDHQQEIETSALWKSKLSGFANVNLTSPPLKSLTIKDNTVKTGDKKKVRNKVTKRKNKNNENNNSQSVLLTSSNVVKERANLKRQRKFGSINKEIIRKYKNTIITEDNDLENNMSLLYRQEDWDDYHGMLMSSLKDDNNNSGIKSYSKDKILTEYTDFRQQSYNNISSPTHTENGTQTQSQIVQVEDTDVNLDERLTQCSWSYPKDFTPTDLGILYDITMSGIDRLGKSNDENGDVTDIVQIDSSFGDINGRSGVFTLSQVLGEKDKIEKDSVNNYLEFIEIEDSCGSDTNNNEDDITFEFIELAKSVKTGKTGKTETDEEKYKDKVKYTELPGTQQLPIDVDDLNYGIDIEIPNSSDIEDNIEDKILDIGNISHFRKESGSKEILEIANSSIFSDNDNSIIVTGCPKGGTQLNTELEEIERQISQINSNINKIDDSDEVMERMIVPTSSPVSSPETENQDFYNDDNDNCRLGILNMSNNEVTTVPNSEDENCVDNEEFLTAPSQFNDVTQSKGGNDINPIERIGFFKGWNVAMLKKQLNVWGIKNVGKLSKKSLEDSIFKVCENISENKWEWVINKSKSGEILDFGGWEEDNIKEIEEEGKFEDEKIIIVREAIKANDEIMYNIMTYQPVNIDKIIKIVNIKEGINIERKIICEILDLLGICWTDVE